MTIEMSDSRPLGGSNPYGDDEPDPARTPLRLGNMTWDEATAHRELLGSHDEKEETDDDDS